MSPGDEVIGIDDWRLRRLDEALRLVPSGNKAQWLVARDQRLLRLRIRDARQQGAIDRCRQAGVDGRAGSAGRRIAKGMARRLKIRASRSARALLVLLLLGVHLLLADQLATSLLASRDRSRQAPRLQVVYLREMALTEPSAPSLLVQAPAPRLADPSSDLSVLALGSGDAAAIAFAASPASAPIIDSVPLLPAVAAVEPAVTPSEPAVQSPPLAAALSADDGSTADPAAGASGPPPFVWPASTRLSYVLTGSYRGEVNGSAQVEWINAAPRYQVNLDVTVGLPFAPLYTREMRSDGRLDRDGLHPDISGNKASWHSRASTRIGLDIRNGEVITDDGRPSAESAVIQRCGTQARSSDAMQDSASQFVQLTLPVHHPTAIVDTRHANRFCAGAAQRGARLGL